MVFFSRRQTVFSWVIVFAIVYCDGTISTLQTPPMGWNSYNQFHCNITEDLIRQTADAMVKTGLNKIGYTYINMDNCWMAPERDPNGRLQADPVRFPSGILSLANYVHSKGLKLGIYGDVGKMTCGDKGPGGYGHYEQDAQSYGEWEVDYLKYDFCDRVTGEDLHPWTYYQQMSDALSKLKRPIVLSICNWGYLEPWKWAPKMANLWRTTQDIWPWWQRIMEILDDEAPLHPFAAPGKFNDPDMLEVGVNGTFINQPGYPKTQLTKREARTHFSLWCMLSAPLILGNDLRNMEPWVMEIISNQELVKVNQDPLVKQAQRVWTKEAGFEVAGVCLADFCTHLEVWMKHVSGGSIVVAFFNRADPFTQYSSQFKSESIDVSWKFMGIPETQTMTAKDLWSGKSLGNFSGNFTFPNPVLPHGLELVRFDKA